VYPQFIPTNTEISSPILLTLFLDQLQISQYTECSLLSSLPSQLARYSWCREWQVHPRLIHSALFMGYSSSSPPCCLLEVYIRVLARIKKKGGKRIGLFAMIFMWKKLLRGRKGAFIFLKFKKCFTWILFHLTSTYNHRFDFFVVITRFVNVRIILTYVCK